MHAIGAADATVAGHELSLPRAPASPVASWRPRTPCSTAGVAQVSLLAGGNLQVWHYEAEANTAGRASS